MVDNSSPEWGYEVSERVDDSNIPVFALLCKVGICGGMSGKGGGA